MAGPKRFVPEEAWSDPRHRRGLWGERLAAAYLTACGWSVEARRFRLGRHDIDLVVRRGSLVAFVEVKTRSSAVCGNPVAAVTPAKCRVLARVAAVWKDRYGRPSDRYRFDVVAVQLGGGVPRLDHVPDAWRLTSSWVT
jgi:putative endonuclease